MVPIETSAVNTENNGQSLNMPSESEMCEKPSTKQPEVIVYSRKNVNQWKKNPTLQQCLESNARSKLDSIIPTSKFVSEPTTVKSNSQIESIND